MGQRRRLRLLKGTSLSKSVIAKVTCVCQSCGCNWEDVVLAGVLEKTTVTCPHEEVPSHAHPYNVAVTASEPEIVEHEAAFPRTE